jgi:hypothetical protein
MVALSSSRVFGDSFHCPPFSGFGNSFVGSRRIFLNPNTVSSSTLVLCFFLFLGLNYLLTLFESILLLLGVKIANFFPIQY